MPGALNKSCDDTKADKIIETEPRIDAQANKNDTGTIQIGKQAQQQP